MTELQSQFLVWLQNIVSTIIPDRVIIFCSRFIPWIFSCVLIMVIIYHIINNIIYKKNEHWFKFSIGITITAIIALAMQLIMKTMFATARPFVVGLHSIYQYGQNDSFPSGHATIFMAISLYIFRKNRLWGIICVCVTVLIGLARVIAGIHWPIDILGGFIVGAFVTWGVISLGEVI